MKVTSYSKYLLLKILLSILLLSFILILLQLFIKGRKNFLNVEMFSVMIDCGSSGTRVHIYTWTKQNFHGQLPKIKYLLGSTNQPLSIKVSPGISDFSKRIEDIPLYLTPLMNFARKNIPCYIGNKPSLYVMATAGMRLLSEKRRFLILNAVHSTIKSFDYFDLKNVEVIDGSKEGYFMWLGVNYLLGRIDNCNKEVPTVGSLEIGGASSQIALEITDFSLDGKYLSPYEHVIRYKCSVDGIWINHKVISLSYLGIGVHSARNRYIESLINESDSKNKRIYDDCLPFKCVSKLDHTKKEDSNILYGTGKWSKCLNEVNKRVFNKFNNKNMVIPFSLAKIIRKVTEKSINGNPMEFIGLSEFWFGTNDFLKKGGVFTATEFSKATEVFCSTDCALLKYRLHEKFYESDDPLKLRLQCFKSALILSTMQEAFMLDENLANLTTLYEVKGLEAQWSIGALIHLLLNNQSENT